MWTLGGDQPVQVDTAGQAALTIVAAVRVDAVDARFLGSMMLWMRERHHVTGARKRAHPGVHGVFSLADPGHQLALPVIAVAHHQALALVVPQLLEALPVLLHLRLQGFRQQPPGASRSVVSSTDST